MNKKVFMNISPHPDDPDIFCGGTVAKLVKEGNNVHYVICTDGSMGTFDLSIEPEKLAEIRRSEQKAAAKILGVKDVIFLNFKDAHLVPSFELREKLIKLIRKVRPNVIMALDPWMPYEAHNDHRTAGMMVTEASVFSGFPHICPEHLKEGLKPWKADEIHFFFTETPNVYIDIEDTIDLKIKAIQQHKSQMSTMGSDPSKIAELVRELAAKTGSKCGKKYAEAYKMFKVKAGHLQIW